MVVKIVLFSALGLLVAAAAAGGIYYMVDGKVGATVIDKDCGASPIAKTSQITVKTKFPFPGIEHTLKDFDNGLCNTIRAGDNGNYAEYYLNSERTVLFERDGGRCLYDSDSLVC